LLSSDLDPPPDAIKNNWQHSMAKSVRASLTMYQNPWIWKGTASSRAAGA